MVLNRHRRLPAFSTMIARDRPDATRARRSAAPTRNIIWRETWVGEAQGRPAALRNNPARELVAGHDPFLLRRNRALAPSGR
jgi:hypothetical protein